MWAKWLHHPCYLGDLQRLARGKKSEMARWPTCGQSGYITLAVLGVPNAVLGSATLSAGTKPRNGYVGHMWARWLHHPCRLRRLQRSARGQKSEMAMLATCGQSGYITPAVLGISNAQRGDKNQKWLCCPHVGKLATSPLLSWGSPTLSWGPQLLARGQILETATWVTCGQSGPITPAVLGISNAQREDKNQKWLRGPHVGKVATSPLPSWGSPTLRPRKKSQKWLCCPHVGKVATSPLLSLGSPTLSWGPQRLARGQNIERATWVTCGQSGSITATVLGIPNAQRGDKNQKWRSGSHGGKVATSPMSFWRSPPLSWGPQRLARGQNLEKATWVTCGQSGSITTAVLGIPNA